MPASRQTLWCCVKYRRERRSSAFRAESSDFAAISLLDHIHTPDPVMLEIEELKRRMALLEEQINDTKKET